MIEVDPRKLASALTPATAAIVAQAALNLLADPQYRRRLVRDFGPEVTEESLRELRERLIKLVNGGC